MKYAEHITKNNVKRFNPKIGNAVADVLKSTDNEKDTSVATSDVLKIQDIDNTMDKVVDVVKDLGKRIEVIEDETGIAAEREKEAEKAAKKVEKAEKAGKVEKSVKSDIEDIKTTSEEK
jgi:SpoU rRNA methylase family enzyme